MEYSRGPCPGIKRDIPEQDRRFYASKLAVLERNMSAVADRLAAYDDQTLKAVYDIATKEFYGPNRGKYLCQLPYERKDWPDYWRRFDLVMSNVNMIETAVDACIHQFTADAVTQFVHEIALIDYVPEITGQIWAEAHKINEAHFEAIDRRCQTLQLPANVLPASQSSASFSNLNVEDEDEEVMCNLNSPVTHYLPSGETVVYTITGIGYTAGGEKQFFATAPFLEDIEVSLSEHDMKKILASKSRMAQ